MESEGTLVLGALYAAGAVAAVAGILVASWFFGAGVRSGTDAPGRDPYECGVPLLGRTGVRVPTKYYLYALLFVLFDVEAAFLFPWAVLYRDYRAGAGVPEEALAWMPSLMLAEGVLFIVVLALGLVWLWRKGVLRWEE